MKIEVTFKTPDAVCDAIQSAVDTQDRPEGLSADEWFFLRSRRREKLEEKAKKVFKWLEYVTVTWDTEEDTCTVERPS